MKKEETKPVIAPVEILETTDGGPIIRPTKKPPVQ